jgi:hypothetical protein
MKTSSLFLAASLSAMLLNVTGAATAPVSNRTAALGESATASPAAPETALNWALPAATVRNIMGEPLQIRPVPAPSGRAEIWVYQREISRSVDRRGRGPAARILHGAQIPDFWTAASGG